MTQRKLFMITGVIALIAAAGIVSLARTLQHPGAIAEMRHSVAELRAAVDSCQALLEENQADLLAHNEWLDSMRARVREMETLHPRGVPADSYSIYMEVFGEYNDSVAGWEQRVDVLQAERAECVALTQAHNAALDSLRRLRLQQR
jgi:hypothetical protein